jgi:hypothetical protein
LRIRYRVAEIANPLSQVKTGLADLVTHAAAATVQPQAEFPFLYEGRIGVKRVSTCPYSVTSNVHQLGANRPMPMRIRHKHVITMDKTTSDPREIRLQFCFMSDMLSPSPMSNNIDDRLQMSHVCYT